MAKTSNRTILPASLKALDAALSADSNATNKQAAFINTMFREGNGMIGDMIKSGETWKSPDGSGDIKSTNDSDNAFFNPIQVRFFAHICANAKVLATVVKVMQSPKKHWGKHSKKTMVTYLDRDTASETFGKRVPCTVSEINSRATSILGKYRRAAWFATETPIKKVIIRWEGETPKAATARVAQHKSLSAYAKKLGIKG